MPLEAGVILSVGGETSAFFNLGPSQALASSLTTSTTYNDVSFFATLFNNTQADVSGIAFLTTAIGPSTTKSNLVDQFSFTISPGATDIELLNEAVLPAGTYYLVLAGTTSGSDFGWLFTPFPTLVAGPGVIEGERFYADPAFNAATKFNAGYPPASTFLNLDVPSDRLLFSVVAADVPEPGTFFTAGLLLTVLVGLRRYL